VADVTHTSRALAPRDALATPSRVARRVVDDVFDRPVARGGGARACVAVVVIAGV